MAYDEVAARIAYSVAFKAAVDLYVRGNELLGDDRQVALEILGLADALNEGLSKRLQEVGAEVGGLGNAPYQQPQSQPTSTASSSPPPNDKTGTPCPDCASNGRTGVITGPNDRGPTWSCSLRQRIKPDGASEYRDVGLCTWKDWGDKYK